jgi:hypothetical protein
VHLSNISGVSLTRNQKIEALCKAKGLTFKPWEAPAPWEVEDNEPCPYPPSTIAAEWWPKVLKLRAALIAELSD